MSTTTIPAETVASSPPIAALLPVLQDAISTIGSLAKSSFFVLLNVSKSITRGAFIPISYAIPIASYIIAPVVVFVSLVADLFLLKPYNSLLYVLQVLYPVYVFCGVAFITAVIIGFSGRVLIAILHNIVLEGEAVQEEEESTVERPVVVKPERRRSVNKRKRVKIED